MQSKWPLIDQLIDRSIQSIHTSTKPLSLHRPINRNESINQFNPSIDQMSNIVPLSLLLPPDAAAAAAAAATSFQVCILADDRRSIIIIYDESGEMINGSSRAMSKDI